MLNRSNFLPALVHSIEHSSITFVCSSLAFFVLYVLLFLFLRVCDSPSVAEIALMCASAPMRSH